jgi:YVTN family beta-propeller protein
MDSNNTNGSRAAWARGFMALFALLVAGLGLMASRAEAAPFAYVTNFIDGTVSVIDTATNTVVATVAVGPPPLGSPSPLTGNTPMSRVRAPTMFR